MCVLFLHALAVPGQSCVGRVLTIAYDTSIDQQVMGQILAVFIQERTGTTINLVKASDVNNARQMVEQDKADLFLSYLTIGMADVGGDQKGENVQETYSLVKQHYLRERSMVWLKPFGYKGPISKDAQAGNQSMAAIVATRKALERFPILERVINKLDGVVDESTLAQLSEKSGGKDIKVVVKEFLKSRNMI